MVNMSTQVNPNRGNLGGDNQTSQMRNIFEPITDILTDSSLKGCRQRDQLATGGKCIQGIGAIGCVASTCLGLYGAHLSLQNSTNTTIAATIGGALGVACFWDICMLGRNLQHIMKKPDADVQLYKNDPWLLHASFMKNMIHTHIRF
jgi:hypothetical protein